MTSIWILAPLVTKVAVFALIRILFWALGAKTVIQDVPILLIVSWLGAIAAIVGAFLALSQQEIKRLFAYGGISHVGLILIGICLGNQTGFAGGVFYLINDAVMQAVGWLARENKVTLDETTRGRVVALTE